MLYLYLLPLIALLSFDIKSMNRVSRLLTQGRVLSQARRVVTNQARIGSTYNSPSRPQISSLNLKQSRAQSSTTRKLATNDKGANHEHNSYSKYQNASKLIALSALGGGIYSYLTNLIEDELEDIFIGLPRFAAIPVNVDDQAEFLKFINEVSSPDGIKKEEYQIYLATERISDLLIALIKREQRNGNFLIEKVYKQDKLSYDNQTKEGLFLEFKNAQPYKLWTPWGSVLLTRFANVTDDQLHNINQEFLFRVGAKLYFPAYKAPESEIIGPLFTISGIDGFELPQAQMEQHWLRNNSEKEIKAKYKILSEYYFFNHKSKQRKINFTSLADIDFFLYSNPYRVQYSSYINLKKMPLRFLSCDLSELRNLVVLHNGGIVNRREVESIIFRLKELEKQNDYALFELAKKCQNSSYNIQSNENITLLVSLKLMKNNNGSFIIDNAIKNVVLSSVKIIENYQNTVNGYYQSISVGSSIAS